MSQPDSTTPGTTAAARGRTRVWLLLGGLFALLAWVLIAVARLKFASGEHYPHYSSWKSEPLGVRALYEACGRMGGVSVERNLAPLSQLESARPDTVFLLLGVQSRDLSDLKLPDDSGLLESVRRRGGRVVLTLNPQVNYWGAEPEWLVRPVPGGDSSKPPEEETKETPNRPARATLFDAGRGFTEKLGFQLAPHADRARPERGWELKGGDAAPAGIAWPRWWSTLHFAHLAPEWRTVATLLDHPVVLRRDWGLGEIVLVSDSFFASNQALREGASSTFLAWLLGDAKRIVFDETVHGASEDVGVMALVREHGFLGFLYGLGLFVALYAWRGASSLVPRSAPERQGVGDGGVQVGQDAGSGLTRLLRRSIRTRDLLATCVEVWKRDVLSHGPDETDPRVAVVEQLCREATKSGKPIAEGYARIVEALRAFRR